MFDYSEYSLEEAQEYCKSFIESIPDRLDWLRSETNNTNGPLEALDLGYEGLDSLWEWLIEQIELSDKNDIPGCPHWHSIHASPYLSNHKLWVVDAVGLYLGELARQGVPGANWDVYHVARKFNDVNQHRTMLHGLPSGPADPIRMVYGEVIGRIIHGEPYKTSALKVLYDYMVNRSDD